MERRRVLASVATGLSAWLAGCGGSRDRNGTRTGSGSEGRGASPSAAGSTPTDAVGRATEAATVVPTTTASTATPGSPTPTRSRTLSVTDAYWRGLSHITEYRIDGVSAVIRRDSKTEGRDRARVAVGAIAYGSWETFASTRSDEFSVSDAPHRLDLSVDLSEAPSGRLAYALVLLPPEGGDASPRLLMMTDPFRTVGDRIERAPHPAALDPADEPRFAREVVEGQYNLSLSGSTDGREWTVDATVLKSVYASRATREAAGTYADYARFEHEKGDASFFGSILEAAAHEHGFTGARARIAFALDVVQGLPFVTDDATAGYDGDLRYAVETLAGGRGDCQDTSALLAVLLEDSAFGDEAAVIEVADHVAAGVAGDYSGAFYRSSEGRDYYYAETTGEDWSVGEVPDSYRGEEGTLYDI